MSLPTATLESPATLTRPNSIVLVNNRGVRHIIRTVSLTLPGGSRPIECIDVPNCSGGARPVFDKIVAEYLRQLNESERRQLTGRLAFPNDVGAHHYSVIELRSAKPDKHLRICFYLFNRQTRRIDHVEHEANVKELGRVDPKM